MPFGKSKESTCKECGIVFVHAKKLSEHFKKAHGLSSFDYTVKYMYDGKRPSCLNCGQETRFVSITEGFKRYCPADAKIAEKIGGSRGGKLKKQWNKGLTKETDPRLKKKKPVHACLWSSQPDILIACDHSWTIPKWGGAKSEISDVFISDDDRLYTFDEKLVTCKACKVVLLDPEKRRVASDPSIKQS